MLPQNSGSEVVSESGSTSGPSLWAYLLLSLTVGLTLCLITPPFFVPDEAAHSFRAIQVGHGSVLAQRNDEEYGGWVDSGVVRAVVAMRTIDSAIGLRYPVAHDRPDGRVSEREIDEVRQLGWTGNREFIPFQNTAIYPPFLYLPQALGWRLGEAVGLTIVKSLLLARSLNLLAATALGFLALLLCNSGRWLLWTYLLLPTGLSLRASCSQDALLLTLTALIGVLLARAIVARRNLSIPELVWTCSLLAIVIPARIPYLPLALVLVLPALNRGERLTRALLGPVLGVLLVFAATGAWQAANRQIGPFVGPGARPAEQETYIKTHPIGAAIHLVAGTARELPALAIKGMEVMGINDIFPPSIIYAALLLAITTIAALSPNAGLTDRRARLLLLALLAMVVAGMSLAEYIIWNPPGSSKVAGLQSRYYLALVPFALLLFGRAKSLGASALPSRWHIGAVVLFVLLVLYSPWVASQRYFRTNPALAIKSAMR